MRIAVIGVGGVGGLYGGRLVQAGEDVVFIARGANLAALRERGLRVTSTLGDFHLAEVQATSDTAEVGPVDLVIVTVKTYQTEDAARILPPLIGPRTMVVSFQNGVDAADRLAAVVGYGPVIGGLTYVSSELVAPGEIRHVSPFARVILGELEGGASARVQRVVEAFKRAGLTVEPSDDIQRDIWTKFMFIAVQGGLTAITRLPVGPIRANPPSWRLYQDALAEIEAVARARGVRLPADILAERVKFVSGLPDGMKSSMLADVENSRRLEIDDFSGAIVRMGEAAGVPTPVHRVMYALLSAMDYQARQANTG